MVADEVVSMLTVACEPITSREIADMLGANEVTREIVNTLQGLVSEGTVRRFGKFYSLTNGKLDTGSTDSNPRKREMLNTDPDKQKGAEKRARSRKKTLAQADEPITTLEQVEQMVEKTKEQAADERARDDRIRRAIMRLKQRASQTIEPVERLDFKLEALSELSGVDPDIDRLLVDITEDLNRLNDLSG